MSVAKGIQYIVRQRMKALNMSVPEMEAKAGVKRNVLGTFVSGTRENPTLETLTRIADVLECSVADLFNPNIDTSTQVKNTEFLKWNESLFYNCANTVTNIINEQLEKNLNLKNKVLDTNKIIFIINQVYKFTIKDTPNGLIANKNFAEFLIENNFPSI